MAILPLFASLLCIQGTTTAGPISGWTGEWIGTLEYRDYSNDRRVVLPTMLRISSPTKGEGVVFRYVFDDGPSKVVEDRFTVVVDPTLRKFIEVPADGAEKTEYLASGFERLRPDGTGRLILTRSGKENDASVDIRETFTVTSRSLTILRESRLPGAPYKFRHIYRLQRVLQPKQASESKS